MPTYMFTYTNASNPQAKHLVRMPNGHWLLICAGLDSQSNIQPLVYELTPISHTECTGVKLALNNIGYAEGSHLDDATSDTEFVFHCFDTTGQVHTVDTSNPEGFPDRPVMIDGAYATETLDPADCIFNYVDGVYGEPGTIIVTLMTQAASTN